MPNSDNAIIIEVTTDVKNAVDGLTGVNNLLEKTIELFSETEKNGDAFASALKNSLSASQAALNHSLESLTAFAQAADTLAVALNKPGQASLASEEYLTAAQTLLDAYAPSWEESGEDFVTYFGQGIEQGMDDLDEAMADTGVYAMEGLIQGMQSKEKDIVAQAEHIAYLIRKALATELDINSPSKVTRELGEYTGEGLILGTVDKIKAMLPSIEAAALTIPAAIAGAGGHIGALSAPAANSGKVIANTYYNSELPIIMENVDMRGEQNVRAVSETLAFLTKQNLAAKGGR